MSEQTDRRAALADPIGRLQRMLEIRRIEDRIQELFLEGIVHGTTHLAQGQEAVAVGLAAAILPSDVVTCTYRGHGIALALGMTPRSVLGEIMGRASGCIGGVGGSMHLCDLEVGLLPTFAIVGAGIPVAAGAALTAQVQDSDGIAVAVFGDGATNIGAFHEALNLASIWRLPVVFLCENNQFGEYSHITLTTPITDLADRGAAYGIPGVVVDGMDVDAVQRAVGTAAEAARAGEGPQLVEAKTYRYAGHSRSDRAEYRDPEELARWQARDPIDTLIRRLQDEGVLDAERVAEVRARVDAEVEAVIDQVRRDPEPDVSAMFANVLA